MPKFCGSTKSVDSRVTAIKIRSRVTAMKIRSRVTATFDRPGSGQNSAGTIWMDYSSGVSSLRILAQMVSGEWIE